jgi:ribosomal protection tetracycline resistance protein
LLAESRAAVEQTTIHPTQAHLEGTIPAATTHPFEIHLPGQTHGEGILTPTFTTYQPLPGTPPSRPRTDGNPLNQKQYLLHLNQA